PRRPTEPVPLPPAAQGRGDLLHPLVQRAARRRRRDAAATELRLVPGVLPLPERGITTGTVLYEGEIGGTEDDAIVGTLGELDEALAGAPEEVMRVEERRQRRGVTKEEAVRTAERRLLEGHLALSDRLEVVEREGTATRLPALAAVLGDPAGVE